MIKKLWCQYSYTIIFISLSFLFGLILINQTETELIKEDGHAVHMVDRGDTVQAVTEGAAALSEVKTSELSQTNHVFHYKSVPVDTLNSIEKQNTRYHTIAQLNDTSGGLTYESNYLLSRKYK